MKPFSLYTKTIFLGLFSLFLIAVIFYGCKKHDDIMGDVGISNHQFESILNTDGDIHGMFTQMNRSASIEKYRSKTNIIMERSIKGSFKVSNEKTGNVSLDESKKYYLEFHRNKAFRDNESKNWKAIDDLGQYYVKIGMTTEESQQLVDAQKKKVEYFLNFLKRYPEFKVLSKEMQETLLMNAYRESKIKNSGIFRKTDEPTQEECDQQLDQAAEAAERAKVTGEIAAIVGLAACILITEGAGAIVCLEAYVIALAVIQAEWLVAYSFAAADYETCISMIPPPPSA